MNTEKLKVEMLYFEIDALLRSGEDRRINGEMFLEKRPKGKYLCFKKNDLIISIPLTKKMYKSLNRFTSGIRMERYYNSDFDEDLIPEEVLIEDDQDCDLSECDMYYMKGGRRLNAGRRQCNLPAVPIVPLKPKEKAAFVTQLFKYIPPAEMK